MNDCPLLEALKIWMLISNFETPHAGGNTKEQADALMSEIIKMKEFDHPNVMGLIGVCLDAGPSPYIVLPFMSGGDLLSHVQQNMSALVLEPGEDEQKVCTLIYKIAFT